MLRTLDALKKVGLRIGKHLVKPKDLATLRTWEKAKLGQGSTAGAFWFVVDSGDGKSTLIVTSDPKKEPKDEYIKWATPKDKDLQKHIIEGTFKFDSNKFTYEFVTSSETKAACTELLTKQLSQVSIGFWRALALAKPYSISLNGKLLTQRKLEDLKWTAASYDLTRKLADAKFQPAVLKLPSKFPIEIVLSGKVASKAETNSLTQQILREPIAQAMDEQIKELIKVLKGLDDEAAKLGKAGKLKENQKRLEKALTTACEEWSKEFIKAAEAAVEETWVEYALEDYERADYVIEASVSFVEKSATIGVAIGGMAGSIAATVGSWGSSSPATIMSLVGSTIALIKSTVEMGQECKRLLTGLETAGREVDGHLKKLEYEAVSHSGQDAVAKQIGSEILKKLTSIKLTSVDTVEKEIADFKAKATGVRLASEKLSKRLQEVLDVQENVEAMIKKTYPGWDNSMKPEEAKKKLGLSDEAAKALGKLTKRCDAMAKNIEKLLPRIIKEFERYDGAKDLASKFEERLDDVKEASKKHASAKAITKLGLALTVPLLNFATFDYTNVAAVVMTTVSTAGEISLGVTEFLIDIGAFEELAKKLKGSSPDDAKVAKECFEKVKFATETVYGAVDATKTLVELQGKSSDLAAHTKQFGETLKALSDTLSAIKK